MSAAEYADIDLPQGLLDVVAAPVPPPAIPEVCEIERWLRTETEGAYMWMRAGEQVRMKAARRLRFLLWQRRLGLCSEYPPTIEQMVLRALAIPGRHPLATMTKEKDDE